MRARESHDGRVRALDASARPLHASASPRVALARRRARAMVGLEYVPPHTAVRVRGLASRPELNGRRGIVLEYAPARARYRVRVDAPLGAEEMYLRPESVERWIEVRETDRDGARDVERETGGTDGGGAASASGRDGATAETETTRDEREEDLSASKAMEEIVLNPDAEAAPIEEIKDTETLLKDFFKDVSEASRDAEVERILSCFRLNPYEFLNIRFDCEMKEIPRSYRKLSLMVHPDKCKNKDAKAAFDALGQAQKLLLDEEFKRALDFNLSQAKEEVLQKWKKEARDDAALRVKYQGNKEGMLEDFCTTDEFHERWKFAARNYIVDLEWRRRKLALRIKGEEKRVTEEEKAEAAQRRKEAQERKEWEREDRREERVSGWRDFMHGKKVKKSKIAGEFKPPTLKTEINEKDKKAFALQRDRVLRPDEVRRAF